MITVIVYIEIYCHNLALTCCNQITCLRTSRWWTGSYRCPKIKVSCVYVVVCSQVSLNCSHCTLVWFQGHFSEGWVCGSTSLSAQRKHLDVALMRVLVLGTLTWEGKRSVCHSLGAHSVKWYSLEQWQPLIVKKSIIHYTAKLKFNDCAIKKCPHVWTQLAGWLEDAVTALTLKTACCSLSFCRQPELCGICQRNHRGLFERHRICKFSTIRPCKHACVSLNTGTW